MTDDNWQQAVLAAMERLVGTEQTAKVAAEWIEHAARDKVEITFLGPYSSGKSTLLRRLVVDGGALVPEWLTISARRETFELNAVDVGDLTFTDAPGFAAGSELHDELAQDALALSDAFLLVVPPQLLTTNRELLGSILSGRYFFDEPRPGVDQAIIAVIAQADSMGIDPDDDADGMRQLAERKRSELIAQLEDSAGVPLPELQVFCVAADAYEEQARQSQPQKSAFDPYRDWDGIEALTAALSALPNRYAELRHAAEIRYFCRVGVAFASQARGVVDELQTSAEELRARQSEWALQKLRVDAVVDDAKGHLHTTLVALADELAEELGIDEAESRSQFNERLTVTLDRWEKRWDGELELVLGEAQVKADDRLGRPRAKRTEAFLRSLATEPATIDAPQPNSRIVSLLNDNKGELQGKARQAFELYAGESVGDLLTKGRRAGLAADATPRLAKAQEASAKAVKAAIALEASLQIVDGVMSIVTVVDAQRRQQELDVQRRHQREEARDLIERNAALLSVDIVDGVGGDPGWRARADAALEVLREQLGLTTNAAAIDDLLHVAAVQQQLVSDLEAVLVSGPPHSAGPD